MCDQVQGGGGYSKSEVEMKMPGLELAIVIVAQEVSKHEQTIAN
jgi:hypothetical protein